MLSSGRKKNTQFTHHKHSIHIKQSIIDDCRLETKELVLFHINKIPIEEWNEFRRMCRRGEDSSIFLKSDWTISFESGVLYIVSSGVTINSRNYNKYISNIIG